MADSSLRMNDIPSEYSYFIGRNVERIQLQEFLVNSKSPIMLVYGPRGVGKSSLVCSVANEYKDRFSVVVWIDRTTAQEVFQRRGENFSIATDVVDLNPKRLVKRRQTNEDADQDAVSAAYKTLFGNPSTESKSPFLLVIDDFDEEYSLLETRNDELALCSFIERFINYPNKAIITSRLRENSFKGLGYDTLEIGLLQEEDVNVIVKKHLGELDTPVWVNSSLEDTCRYIWIMSGGLAEFISRNIIPVTTQQGFLVERDPRFIKAIQEFARCYLLQRQQPRNLDGYRAPLTSQDLEKRLIFLFAKDSFTEFVLWKWINLKLSDGFLENDLGEALGLNMLDGAIAAKFNSALRELHKYRFVARQIEFDTSKEVPSRKVMKWILLPVISFYLQEYWPTYRQYWNDEAIYLRNFIEAYTNQPSITSPHFKRILAVINWCYENESWNNLISLGISTSKASEKFLEIETDELSQSSVVLTLIDICKKTANALDQQKESENWMFLIKVLLVLAKLYSSKKINGDQLLAREYSVKALDLSREKQSPEEFDATILTAKIYIYLGEFKKADELLLKIYEKEQLNDNWAITAFLLATILRRDNDDVLIRPYSWYRKIIDSVDRHKKIDIALQSAIDASIYCAHIEHPGDIFYILSTASELLKQKNEYVRKFPLLAIQVLAYCAAAYEKRKDFDACKSLLNEAKQYCKEFGFEQRPFYMILTNKLVYLDQKEINRSLFEELIISTAQESDNFYGFDELFTNCPICKRRLNAGIEIISCDKCGGVYHKHCLVGANIFSCPGCNSTLLMKE